MPDADGEKISVVNTVPSRRKGHIRVPKGELIPKELKHQILPDETVVTDAIELDGVEVRDFDGILQSHSRKA